jgi:hypothetical protein
MWWTGIVGCVALILTVYLLVARNRAAIHYNRNLRRRVLQSSATVTLDFSVDKRVTRFDAHRELVGQKYDDDAFVAKMFSRARRGGGWGDFTVRAGHRGLVTYTFFCTPGEVPGSVHCRGLSREAVYT